MAKKRRASPVRDADASPPKRRARQRDVVVVPDSDEEPLDDILAKIKAQEESEALASRLASASQTYGETSQMGQRTQDEPMVTDDTVESDEALARRLAAEWAAEEAELVVPIESQPSVPGSSRRASAAAGPSTSDGGGIAANDCATDTVPDVKLRTHEELFVGTRKCTKCNVDVASPRGYVTFTSGQLPPPSLVVLLHATCQSCKAVHCRGCFKLLSCQPRCKGTKNNEQCPVLTCCAEVRAIALFEALGGFDRQYLGERATSDTRSKEAAAKYRKSTVNSVGPGGTGYGTGASTSYYYGGPTHGGYDDYDDEWDAFNNFPGSKRRGRGGGHQRGRGQSSTAVALANHWDELLVRALSTITALLPSPYSDDAQVYDMLPHSSITQLLALSQLPELLASLLRNDSITDWTTRSDLYNAMLTLLRRMADCELTLEVLIGERYELASSSGLEDWMWRNGEIKWAESDGKPIKANALYTYFKKLTKQSEAFLAGASQLLEGDGDGDGAEVENTVQSVSLCGEIIAARDNLERAMKILAKDPPQPVEHVPIPPVSSKAKGKGNKRDKGKGPDPAIDVERRYAQACERLAFQHVAFPQTNGTYTHYAYAKELKSTASATRNPKDRLRLVKELAVMATSLPPGVWVRVDEVRNDAIKIMIAGPEGTPYEGGLFEFDCFLPLEYPHKPPLMHLRTTGGGSVRFNPNLYNCGKVCLSLLGTWPGRPEEQWSSKSTLLQVLVSIQSMILVELPYFNEPGYGKATKTSSMSISYNKNIAAQTSRWAIVDWLRDAHKDSMWAEVIASHFTIREHKIRQCMQSWANSNPAIRKYNGSGVSAYPIPMPDPDDMFGMAGAPISMPMPASMGAVMMMPMAYNPPPRRDYGASKAMGPMDLLAEFDQGMERVKAWRLAEEAQGESQA